MGTIIALVGLGVTLLSMFGAGIAAWTTGKNRLTELEKEQNQLKTDLAVQASKGEGLAKQLAQIETKLGILDERMAAIQKLLELEIQHLRELARNTKAH